LVGRVFEETVLLTGTVAESVRFGKPDATAEEVWWALKQAEATGFVANLPHGLDTQVGEGGVALSGGQRQRLALARALLLQPGLLVLDDATSALGPATEERILRRIRKLPQRPTIIVVSHRPSVIGLVDRFIILEDGAVSTEGSSAQVAARSAWFHHFVAHGAE
jgi:ATP-binding cassette subfamily B protein